MSGNQAAWGGPQGFSLLIWEDNPEIDLTCKENLEPETEGDEEPTTVAISGDPSSTLPTLLQDAMCLLSGRWGLQIDEHYYKDQWYLWAVCTRFHVGEETLRRALGDLTHHLSFQKGAPTQDFNTAVRYKICRERWGVPQVITEKSADTSGGGGLFNKRPRH